MIFFKLAKIKIIKLKNTNLKLPKTPNIFIVKLSSLLDAIDWGYRMYCSIKLLKLIPVIAPKINKINTEKVIP